VAVLQYRTFLPTLVTEVLPHLGTTGEAAQGAGLVGAATQAATRLCIFFGPIGLLLALVGYARLVRAAEPLRRTLFAAAAGGLLLALLRAGLPILFSDAKEVELLAGPVAVAVALGVTYLHGRSRAGRALGFVLLFALLTWSAFRAAELYASRLASLIGA
jgi:hypothetical protein